MPSTVDQSLVLVEHTEFMTLGVLRKRHFSLAEPIVSLSRVLVVGYNQTLEYDRLWASTITSIQWLRFPSLCRASLSSPSIRLLMGTAAAAAAADMDQKSIRSQHKPYFLKRVRSLSPVDGDGTSEIRCPRYITVVRIPTFLDSHTVPKSQANQSSQGE